MKPKALVIEDDPAICDAVSDILDSLDHDHDSADSVESAREYLGRVEYTYILLDLEIPVKARRSFPRVQDGENLLEEIVRRRGASLCPIVIVMTAHGTDGPDLAVDIMKKGAADYVTKPFKTSGRTIDKSIRAALSALGQPPERSAAPPATDRPKYASTSTETPSPSVFSGGVMVFFQDRVELCGIDICSGPRSQRRRQVLNLLRASRTDGSFCRYSGNELAMKLGNANGQNTASGVIRDLRECIRAALLAGNIESNDDDVILSGGPGYRFSEKLTVQDAESGYQGQSDSASVVDVPDGPNHVRNEDVPNVPDDDAGRRQHWILQQLGAGSRVNTSTVVSQFRCAKKTAQRDFTALKNQDLVEFVGASATGYYRLRKGKKPQD